jgi:branched-chain amino acid aminotransferase
MGKKYAINNGQIGEVTAHLYDTLTGIQWGNLPDSYGWIYQLEN